MSITFKHTKSNALANVKRRLNTNYAIAVGFPSSKTKSIEYPNGQSVIMVAASNNFGVPELGIPRRPFMSIAREPAIKKVRPMYRKLTSKLVKGGISQKKIAQIIAPEVVTVFKKVIVDLRQPPNSPATIARKKSDNPLIDTGLMVQSLTYEVRKVSDVKKGEV